MAAENFFTWGENGSKLTPEQIAIAKQLLARKKAQGADTSPVQHWTQGAARVADALSDVVQERRLGSQEKENNAYNSELVSSILGSGAAPVPGATGSAMPSVDSSGNVAIPSTGKEWETIAPRLVSDLSKDFQLTPEQAAGVVGQLGHESAGFGKLQEVNPLVPGSRGGYGYAQWTGPRRKDFEAWAGSNNLDPNSYEANYGFLRNELANSPEGAVLPDLRAAPDAMTAGRVFTDKFLRPGIPNYDSRAGWTQKALAFANAPTASAPGEVASLDPSIGIPMPGAEGQMRATAPAQPMPSQVAPQAALPTLPASTVEAAPAVASVPAVADPQSQIPPEFMRSPQIANADPTKGILPVLLGGTPASPQQVAQAASVAPPVAPQGMGNEAIIRALTSPQASESTRRIAGIILQQQQARQQAILENQLKQADPKYRQDLEKGNIELQNLREPKMSPAEQAADQRAREKIALEREQFDQEVKKGQWQKLTDGRLYNQTSGEFRDAPPPAPGTVTPKFDDISSMRKEIQQLPAYKNLAAAAPIYKAMAETAGRDSKASDLNLVYGLGKIMDPTSVVREGEMIMVKNTASLPDWLQGAIASLNGGAALTPETRKAIMTEAYGRVKGYNDEFQQNMGQYQGIVQRNGINPADVIPEVDKFDPWTPPEATGPVQIKNVDDYNALPKGTPYLDPNGKLRTKQ